MVEALIGCDPMARDRVERVRSRVIGDRHCFWDAVQAQLANPVAV